MYQGFVQYLADASQSLMPCGSPGARALIKHSQSPWSWQSDRNRGRLINELVSALFTHTSLDWAGFVSASVTLDFVGQEYIHVLNR
jgi:predicted membrane metal-binding protein